ncbi:MAG: DUF6147 family protein [Lachnospiraceae bacterium]
MKKVLVWIMSIMVLVGISFAPVKAAENPMKVDGSSLLKNVNEVTSERTIQPRGAFLQQGNSSLVKTGANIVTVGGNTIAQQVVKSIGITVILERIDENDMKWVIVDSWNKDAKNATIVQLDQTVTVPRDTFYRARSLHFAETDTSSSFTDGLFIK